jgi:tight adherence protein B
MESIYLILLLVGGAVALLAYGALQVATRRQSIVAQRVKTYGDIEAEAAREADVDVKKMSPATQMLRRLLGSTYLENIQDSLTRADLPMRPSEYILLRLLIAGVGYLMGAFGLGHHDTGAVLAFAGFFVPAGFVYVHQRRRTAKFVRQLANALMLLTTSLRSGYSFLKGLELVAKEMDDPISKELTRMLREVSLGATIETAMTNLGQRIKSQDLDIVISAYLVQKDVGGNLTEIMEKVAETIRERLRIQGDIRVLTAQGRMSGLILWLVPYAVFFLIWAMNRDYLHVFVEPPIWAHLFGLAIPRGIAILFFVSIWQFLGGYVIYRIVNIKV